MTRVPSRPRKSVARGAEPVLGRGIAATGGMAETKSPGASTGTWAFYFLAWMSHHQPKPCVPSRSSSSWSKYQTEWA